MYAETSKGTFHSSEALMRLWLPPYELRGPYRGPRIGETQMSGGGFCLIGGEQGRQPTTQT